MADIINLFGGNTQKAPGNERYSVRDVQQMARYLGVVDPGIINVERVFTTVPEQAAKIVTRAAYEAAPEKIISQVTDNSDTDIENNEAWRLGQTARTAIVNAFRNPSSEQIDA